MVVTTRMNARPQLVKEEELVKETDEDDFDEGTDEAVISGPFEQATVAVTQGKDPPVAL